MGMSDNKLHKFLTETSSGHPAILIELVRNGVAFTQEQLVSLIRTAAGSSTSFLLSLVDSVAIGIFDLEDEDTLLLVNTRSYRQLRFTYDTYLIHCLRSFRLLSTRWTWTLSRFALSSSLCAKLAHRRGAVARY